jgi:hypothetical protein
LTDFPIRNPEQADSPQSSLNIPTQPGASGNPDSHKQPEGSLDNQLRKRGRNKSNKVAQSNKPKQSASKASSKSSKSSPQKGASASPNGQKSLTGKLNNGAHRVLNTLEKQ